MDRRKRSVDETLSGVIVRKSIPYPHGTYMQWVPLPSSLFPFYPASSPGASSSLRLLEPYPALDFIPQQVFSSLSALPLISFDPAKV
jgi:hypothetical protein